jgi:hypothetical protein
VFPTTSNFQQSPCPRCAISCTPIAPQHHPHVLAVARVRFAEGYRPRVVLGLQCLHDVWQVSQTICSQSPHPQLSTLSPSILTVLQSSYRRIRPRPATRDVCPLIHHLRECNISCRGPFPRLRLGSTQQRVLLGRQFCRSGEPIEFLHTTTSCAVSDDHPLSRVALAPAFVIMSFNSPLKSRT